ncbi:hypothetical protein AMTRI_Chr02g258030 [Amborella trichopoda]
MVPSSLKLFHLSTPNIFPLEILPSQISLSLSPVMKVQSKKTHKGKPGPKISKDCSGIRKPEKKQQVIPEERSRPPIIIYTQTPEIIHIEAQDFMSLVQRLTGKESGSVSSSDMISSSSSLSGSGSGSVVKLSDGAGTDSESPAFLYQPSVLGAFMSGDQGHAQDYARWLAG